MDSGITFTTEKRKNIETLVQDGSCKRAKAECQSPPENCLTLLHLSDDVLLNIFGFCSPTDIRALSFCNKRLNILCYDRSLWKRVDLRDRRMGVEALSLYVRTLPKQTAQALCVRGLVGRPNNYNHHSKQTKPTPTTSASQTTTQGAGPLSQPSTSAILSDSNAQDVCGEEDVLANSYNVVKESGNSSPKPFSPSYDSAPSPTSGQDSKGEADAKAKPDKWGKPESVEDWTVTKDLMSTIKRKCPHLKELRLEFCYIDCNAIQSSSFPPTLETLSLRGSVCRNVPLSRTYLFRLHEHCPNLTEIDLSGCGWLASHSLLVLSKVPTLKRLSLKHCWGLGECVAYASLSARYGFKSLEVLDIRGTPMGDSEITAFSLIGTLKELLLQGSGVVDDTLVAAHSAHSPPLRSRNDTGEPLSWETQYPYECSGEWSWSSESEDEAEPEVGPGEGAGGGEEQNVNFSRNAFEQMVDEPADPFEAVGRVHVIYVDVRRAPHNNMLRVRYAPVHQPQEQPPPPQDQPQPNPPAPEQPPQPEVEVQVNNPEENNLFPDVIIQRDGENRINFRVQYANNMEGPPRGDEEQLEQQQQPPPQPAPGILHFWDIFRNLQNQREQVLREYNHRAQGEGGDGGPHEINVPRDNEAPPADNPVAAGNPPRPLARPGEFLRRGPAFVVYPNEQQANRMVQQQQQAQVVHRREVVPQLLYDFRHTIRQLENFVGKLRREDHYQRLVRRVHFFRRMLQQIYTNEPLFTTDRAIPEQADAPPHHVGRITRLIDTTCHHLERLIARAIQYPPDEIPFRINYNYIDDPDYAEEMAQDENDTRMRPETVEFYIQRYFGVPPAEEVNAQERHPQVDIPQQLHEPVLRVMDANMPAADELVDIVHNVLHNNRVENMAGAGGGEAPHLPNQLPPNNEEMGRMVNIHNINIEIHEHVQQPVAPGPAEPNIDRIIDQHVERVVHNEIRAMRQEHLQRRNRNDPRVPLQDERIRIEGPFVIRGDVMEEGGRRRRRVVHIPLQLNLRGPGQPNDVSCVGTSNLITDASLLRFGHSKNVVHIGGDAQMQHQSAVRGGQLTTLVCRGYPRVTDRALSHLAVATPKLTRLDLSHTGITHAGALAFQAARQDCELIAEHLTDADD